MSSAYAFEGERYVVASEARPRAVRKDPDGSLWAEFPLTLARDTPPGRRGSVHTVLGPRPAPRPEKVPEVPEDVPGFSMKPDPMEATSVAEFIEMMRRYRRWAGDPSFRKMSLRVGTCSAAGFCEALKSDRLPTFPLLNAFVVSLGGDSDDFQRWATAWRALDGQAPGHSLLLVI
ncbi:hypothetical protein [Nocardiopsis alba]|uniref:Uncharacterized protein n=1 Tax=Nocardiopsis alba (strain ATCC BAA-2165 / BE74) TaxID=1205910 RepID=J7L1I9_NOCAA|nr:hypothetical protein [Nocardiopsis alba]AFR06606.1 hypothetical protein B005_4911 [Nocardiopsis alba ATCC BAA-2165]